MSIIGLDLSLNSAGVAVIPDDWDLKDWTRITLETISVPVDGWACRGERLARIAQEVALVVMRAPAPRFVAFESYAFRMRSTSAHLLPELGGAVRLRLWLEGIGHQADIPASQARKTLLHKVPIKDKNGNKIDAKTLVRIVLETQGGLFKSLDESDAFCVANAALHQLQGRGLAFIV